MLIDGLLYYITIAAWVTFAAALLFVFIRTLMRQGVVPAIKRVFAINKLLIALILLVGLTLLNTSLVFVKPQEVGVVVSLLSPEGYRNQPLRSGIRWIVPLVEEVKIYPIYWQTYTMSSKPLEGQTQGNDSIRARTYDGQEVAMDATVIFRIDPENTIRVHVFWQDRYLDNFVRPTLRGLIRTEVSQFKVDEVNSYKRKDLESSLEDQLRTRFEEQGFILDAFILRNISFSPEYATAVELKQVGLQEAYLKEHQANQIRELAYGQADEVRIKAQAQAEAVVIKAQAEAEALRLIAEALSRNPELLTYRYIEKLAPSIRTMLVPADMPYVLPIPDSLLEGEVEAVITEAPTIPEVSIPTPTPWVIQSQQYTPTPYFPEPTTVTGGDAQEPTATPTPYTP
jgi:regulator of protease activity HflC (stomatin/prohibitin superfamily)